ncbi:hypothetical protein [Spirosoma utsteinense]|uniref:Uncharacterized protein n=1 Tax=Spirosoma utsteinense TaxID=2585773 RepID=A0ABR6W8M6_9BACT|nr:hypothetical protein [Spirosoma utsteinense]MBC3787932.1 hypothetical protein [Spirosoma utsteinense]MBC3792145.1 hypothetical protein [Spirosoma utsteinense]
MPLNRTTSKVFTELVSKTWTTNTTGVTGKAGQYNIRAFNGNYEITIKKGDRRVVQQTTVGAEGRSLVVNL